MPNTRTERPSPSFRVSPSCTLVTAIEAVSGWPHSANTDVEDNKHKKTPASNLAGVFRDCCISLSCKVYQLFLGATDTATETLGEAINTATGINDFLLASVERVALAAHVYVERLTQG